MMIHAKRMCLAVLFATIVAHGTGAQEMDRMRQYLVTIENLSSGQPLTPPLIATHTEKVQLYQVGDAAGPGVQAIAENGDLIPLLEWLEGSMEVADVVVSDAGPLVPAGNPGGTDFASSVTLTVSAGPRAHHLSFRSRLRLSRMTAEMLTISGPFGSSMGPVCSQTCLPVKATVASRFDSECG